MLNLMRSLNILNRIINLMSTDSSSGIFREYVLIDKRQTLVLINLLHPEVSNFLTKMDSL